MVLFSSFLVKQLELFPEKQTWLCFLTFKSIIVQVHCIFNDQILITNKNIGYQPSWLSTRHQNWQDGFDSQSGHTE